MRWLLDLSIALTRVWVVLYTRGLPAELRAERREEIDCDLWEHQVLADLEREPVTGTAIEILVRWLAGIPSDITWRIETGASIAKGRTLVNEALYMRGLVAIGVAMSLFLVAIGGAAAVAGLLDPDDGWAVGGAITALAGAAVTAGLLTSRRNPPLGIALVAGGSLAIAIVWSWLVVFTIPVGLTLIGIATLRAWQTGWPRRTGTRPPTGAPAA